MDLAVFPMDTAEFFLADPLCPSREDVDALSSSDIEGQNVFSYPLRMQSTMSGPARSKLNEVIDTVQKKIMQGRSFGDVKLNTKRAVV
jgi:hypothetical protein